jgi:hypothetical protein
MVNFPGRNGRRRRVLNDEVLSASSSHAALRAIADDDVRDTPRYSDAAGVENHPQVTDFVPRQYRTIALLVLVGGVATAVLGALHYFGSSLADVFGMTTPGPFDLAAPGSMASWVSAVVLLLCSVLCMLIYSIRRHQIDDYRGRYRVWLAAAAACLLLSLNSVAALHDVLASAGSHLIGWSLLRDGSIWWLTLAGLPLSWTFARTLLDAKECRVATVLYFAAALSYSAGAAAYFGALPSSNSQIDSTVAGTALVLGHWMLLSAAVAYARFVVLDAQGLVAARPKTKHLRKTAAMSAAKVAPSPTAPKSLLATAGYSRQRPAHDLQPAKPAEPDQWVDGSRPERDRYNDDDESESSGDSRRLSKADRKRLRKFKTQNRAA